MRTRGSSSARWALVATMSLVPVGVVAVPASPAVAAATVTFAAAADHSASSAARSVFRSIGAAHPDFALSMGDLSYDQVTPAAWCQLVKDELNAGAGLPSGSAYGETLPFVITQGNHESSTLDGFLTPTCLPDRTASTPAPFSTYGRDHVLDYPAADPTVRVIVTSPGMGAPRYTPGSPALQWLSDTIDAGRASGIPWIVVSDHHNYISSGTKSDEIGSAFFNLLVEKKVDLVLQGHEHTYQRSKQLQHSPGCPEVPTGSVDPDCISDDGSDGVYQAGAGPVLVVSGTGGAPLYPISASDPEAGYFAVARGSESGSIFGWSKVTATDMTLQLSYQSVGPASTDTFTITKGDPPPPDQTAPSVPGGVTATAVAGRVEVAWAPSTDDRGVTGYQVRRDGTPLATVATTTYADTSALPGRTYSYTVRAADAAGNVSADSEPALVTTPASSAVLYSETWPGADGSPWPSAWTATAGSGGVVDTRAGAGALTVAASTTGSYARALLSAGDAVADADLLTRFRWSSTAATSYASLYLRGSGGWQNGYRPQNGYGLELSSASTTVTVRRNVGGVVTNLASVAGLARTTVPQWVRFRVEGSAIGFRTWLDGAAEPTTWTWSGTDTAVTAPGRVHVSLNRGSSSTVAQTVSLDDLRLTAPGVVGPPPDTTPPSTPTGVSATAEPTETNAVIGWDAATDDVGVVGYEVLRDGVLLPGSVATSPWFDVTVVPGQSYTYAVRAFDAAGNRSAPSAGVPVTIPLPVDEAPPSTPTGLIATAASTTSAVLSWVASTDDVGVTAYDVLRDGVVVATVTGTAWTDSTLSPATSYLYAVQARDAAGNVSEPSEPAPVTTPAPDSSPPSAPTDLVATATTGSSVTLSWTASADDVGVTAYDVLRDGSVVASVTGTSHIDTTVSPATSYVYAVRARDAAGNASDPSASAPVTTPDTVAPSVPGGLTAVATSGTSVTVTWSASTDDVGVTAYDVVRDGAPLATVPGTSLVDDGVVAGATYTYAVRARDAAGNSSELSAAATVTPPLPVTELYRDTWSLPDGSPWGSAWSAGTGLGGAVSAASGTGQLAVPGTQNAYARVQLTGVTAVSGTDVTFSYRWSSSTSGAYLNVYLRGSGGWQNAYRPRSGYGIELSSNSSTIALRRNVNGTTTTLVSTSGAQQVGTAVQRVRIQVAGSTLRYRTWPASQSEPTTWRATVTDTAVTANGQVFVSLVKGSGAATARTVQLDDLVVAPAP